MNYYIKDTIKSKIVYFNTIPEVVSYLEELCQQKFRQTRKTYMLEMESLGHGYDDGASINFTNFMREHFEVGVRKSDGSLMRTNIHELARNNKYRNETGD